MADGDGLENHCGGNVTVGSNPTPSAQPGKTMPDLGLCTSILGRHLVLARSQMQPNCRRMSLVAGSDLDAFPQVGARKKEARADTRRACIVDRSGCQCLIDPGVSDLLAAIDALRVHPQQNLDAVPSTVGHLGNRDSRRSARVRRPRAEDRRAGPTMGATGAPRRPAAISGAMDTGGRRIAIVNVRRRGDREGSTAGRRSLHVVAGEVAAASVVWTTDRSNSAVEGPVAYPGRHQVTCSSR